MANNILETLSIPLTGVGPKGGDTEKPYGKERRRAAFTPAGGDPDALHRFEGEYADRAVIGLKDEQPWHRIAAQLILAGKSNAEIAELAGKQPATVSLLRGQRWFQELLAREAATVGADIQADLRSEGLAAVRRIVDIAESSESDRTRLAANIFLVEQANGKAVQKVLAIHGKTDTFASPADEMAELQRQLAEVRAARAAKKTVEQPPKET